MLAAIEPCVRRVVEETLGVSADQLAPEVSLTDDLAADSLDLVEVALGLESALGIVVPERLLEEVRTYGDLVRATALLARRRREAPAEPAPTAVWVRLTLRGGRSELALERCAWLTPYVAETFTEDARRAGHDARLELTVRNGTRAELARVRERFRPLGKHGVEVHVGRGEPQAASPARPEAQKRSARRTVWSRWAPIESNTMGAPTRAASRPM